MTASSPPPSDRPSARPPRDGQGGVGRPGGLLIAILTATIVFAVGQVLLPSHDEPAAPAPTPAPLPPPPVPNRIASDAAAGHLDGAVPRPTSDAAAVADAIREDAAVARSGRIAADAAVRPDRGAAHATEPEAEASAAPPATHQAPEGAADERPADKDLAREAWRHNRPDISSESGKSSILIPLKGSIAGASFRVTNKPHAVIVTLPRAASLITMRVYRVGRDGFRLLWINQAEKDADPKDGTSLKLGLSELGDPLVEIKDDFVRVTVRHPTDAAPAPEPDHGAKTRPAKSGAGAPAPKGASAPKSAPAAAAPDPSAD
jgi:hypothetical protein